MTSAPFCSDCPDREACSSGFPCVLVRDVNCIDDAVRKAPLVYHGRPVGVVEIDGDNQTISCKFDIKSLSVTEVIQLFWLTQNDTFVVDIDTRDVPPLST